MHQRRLIESRAFPFCASSIRPADFPDGNRIFTGSKRAPGISPFLTISLSNYVCSGERLILDEDRDWIIEDFLDFLDRF